MKTYIDNFALDVKNALALTFQERQVCSGRNISNIIICGIDDSGTAGRMACEIIFNDCIVPVHISNDYFLPEFAGENTLVIVCSYSGNMEEILLTYIQAQQKKSEIVCITSGGKLAGLAKENSNRIILLPDGLLSSAVLAYTLISILKVLHSHRLITDQYISDCRSAVTLLEKEKENIKSDARETSLRLQDKINVIYSLSQSESIAIHFRQQLNKKVKALAWHNVFPELNHNEIQGWQGRYSNLFIIIFRNENDFIRSSKKMDIAREIIQDLSSGVKEVYSRGNSRLEQLLYLINWCDRTSCYAAMNRKMISADTSTITAFNAELEKG